MPVVKMHGSGLLSPARIYLQCIIGFPCNITTGEIFFMLLCLILLLRIMES